MFAALCLLASADTAAAQSPDQVRGWKAEWDKTVAAAKKEGRLVIVMSSSEGRRDFLLTRWKRDFPEIALSATVMRGASLLPGWVAERRAGRYLWDVFHSGAISGVATMRAGLLDPLLPELILPEVKDPEIWGGWDDAFYDNQRKYLLALVSDLQSPYYNAGMLAPEKLKALGLKVLLEPSLKGKSTWFDPRIEGPGASFMVLLAHVLGEERLRRFMVDQDPVFVATLREAAEALVRGKAAVAFAGNLAHDLQPYIEAGIKIDARPFGNGPDTAFRGTGGATLGVFNKRPHPNAARVFVNWIMTKRIAAAMAQATGFDSRRADVVSLDPESAAIPGVRYIEAQREDQQVVARKWMAELRRLRPQ